MRFGQAWSVFWRVWRDETYAERVAALDQPVIPPDPAAETRRLAGEQLHLISLLQRDGRLLDFLSEDLKDYSDEQIGAAVRDIHRDCREALSKYVELAAVLDREEDSTVDIPAGFDPSRIRLAGNVKGSPPYRGVLAHRGWLARSIRLPDRGESGDPMILSPAEVEIA